MKSQNERRQTILFFGNDWFADNRTSSHHISRWLSKRFNVYYFECPGIRAPNGSKRDTFRVLVKLFRFLRGVRKVEAGPKVRTLLQIPLHRFAVIRRINSWFLLTTVRWLKWREGIKDPIAWFAVPHVSTLLGRLGESISVYYCTDDHTAFPGVHVETLRQMDEELSRKSDLIFVVSEPLLEAKLKLNPHTFLSPHGVDLEHFSRAQVISTSIPSDVTAFPTPIIGYFGLVGNWIDMALINFLAEKRPQWSFVIIGRVTFPADQLPIRQNLFFLGQRPYESLPEYGKAFSAAIIPYKPNRWTYHANPLKLREYLAMGKPVVTLSTPETEKYAHVVELAKSFEEFLGLLEKAVASSNSPSEVKRRMESVASESWDARLTRVLGIVEKRASERPVQANSERTKPVRLSR